LGEIERRMEGGEDYFLSEDAMWDLEWLFDALNEFAPEGTYFGTCEGDGSDIGFWPIEEDDNCAAPYRAAPRLWRGRVWNVPRTSSPHTSATATSTAQRTTLARVSPATGWTCSTKTASRWSSCGTCRRTWPWRWRIRGSRARS